eukprot:3615134-Rhodomonas_salina.1
MNIHSPSSAPLAHRSLIPAFHGAAGPHGRKTSAATVKREALRKAGERALPVSSICLMRHSSLDHSITTKLSSSHGPKRCRPDFVDPPPPFTLSTSKCARTSSRKRILLISLSHLIPDRVCLDNVSVLAHDTGARSPARSPPEWPARNRGVAFHSDTGSCTDRIVCKCQKGACALPISQTVPGLPGLVPVGREQRGRGVGSLVHKPQRGTDSQPGRAAHEAVGSREDVTTTVLIEGNLLSGESLGGDWLPKCCLLLPSNCTEVLPRSP